MSEHYSHFIGKKVVCMETRILAMTLTDDEMTRADDEEEQKSEASLVC